MKIQNFFKHTKQNLVVDCGDQKLATEIFWSLILWQPNLFLGTTHNMGNPSVMKFFLT
jgi:hypothetical protein